MPSCRFKEGSVEGEPVKGLLEVDLRSSFSRHAKVNKLLLVIWLYENVLAETALTGASAPGHLGEVEPSCMSEKKLINRLFLAMPKWASSLWSFGLTKQFHCLDEE